MSHPASPSPVTAGPGSFLSSLSEAHPAASETRKCLSDELEGRFHCDQRVLELLGMPNTAQWHTHVDTVHAAFALDQLMCNHIDYLRKVTDPEEPYKNREVMMYRPLCSILRWISDRSTPDPSLDFDRQWVILGKEGPTRDVESQSEGNRKPDLVLVERPRGPQAVLQDDHRPYWRAISATAEIKWKESDGPTPDTVILNTTVLQAIDCVRLHISCRPFLRWAFSLLICGMDFYIIYVDRAGGAITPRQNLCSNMREFIEFVLYVTTTTRSALGQDPDVLFERDEPQHTLRSANRNPSGHTHPWDAKYPIYSFPGLSGGDRIRVVGKPHFASFGLLGRGTTVWPVRTGTGPEQVLKCSWRRVGRQSESAIYKGIQAVHPKGIVGLCQFVAGEDYAWDRSFQRADPGLITPTINPRRNVLTESLEPEHDRVLHRLILNTRGMPIGQFTTPAHLIQVLVSALQAHKELVDKGILHRDISSGNILIATYEEDERYQEKEDGEDGEDEKNGEDDDSKEERGKKEIEAAKPAGLLTDVELAKILPGHDPRLQSLIPNVGKTGPDYTCTLQFTATEVLVDISQDPEVKVTPSVRHDLESFFYVAIWAILIKSRAYDASIRSKDLNETQNKKWEKAKGLRTRLMKRLFGPHDIISVVSGRVELTHSPFFEASTLFPSDLKSEFDMFRDLWERLLKLFVPAVQSKRDLTHAEVISALEPSGAS